MSKKKTKWLAVLLTLVLVMIPFSAIYGATDIAVDITKDEPRVFLSNEGERVFDIGYNFGVDFDAQATGLDLVLTLDRSNSMLRLDPSTDLPVADAVWQAVNAFLTEYYSTYPDSNVAVVSFGTNGNKSDNWKYFDNLEDALEEIEEVYDYRDLWTNYKSNFSAYFNNNYRYAWENWQITDGATNLAAAFDYSATTVDHKQVVDQANDQDVILLFTDGVATQGGSKSQKNYNYPKEHNTNTIAAYEAGIDAQGYAEIITVGYFEGIEYQETKDVARDTLDKAQNSGMFEASQTDQLTNIFATVVDELNYVGTGAMVTETIEDEFELVEGSISPKAFSVTEDNQGRTVIKWQLGNVIASDYSFGYQVKAKDHVYPTGSGAIKIPINLDALLSYTDLNGNLVEENLGHNETTIPPMGNQPLVDVQVTYGDGFGYLVGDPIRIKHDMVFENEAPYDYREILVRDLTKTISGGNFGTELALTVSAQSDGWQVDGQNLVFDIQESEAVTGNQNLAWSNSVDLTLVPMMPGTYDLGYGVDYQLINSAALDFDFSTLQMDPGSVTVKEGKLKLNLRDDHGDAITNVTLSVDGLAKTSDLIGDQIVTSGFTSGSHTITFQVPSGYHLDAGNAGVSLVGDQVTFTETFSYAAPEVVKDISFVRLDVRNIGVTDRSGGSTSGIDQVTDTTEAIVTFELVRDLDKIGLRLTDDYSGSDHGFTLDQTGGYGFVTGPTGQVNGFTMVGDVLTYNGSTLEAGVYQAYGLVTPPSGLGDHEDYDYQVYVDQLTAKGAGESLETVLSITSSHLLIGLEDDTPPVIVSELNDENTTINVASYDIKITDKVTIVAIEVYLGTLSLEAIDEGTEVVDYSLERDLGSEKDISTDIDLTIEMVEDMLVSKGDVTVYAKDAFGNEAVHVIDVENEDINSLLNSDIK